MRTISVLQTEALGLLRGGSLGVAGLELPGRWTISFENMGHHSVPLVPPLVMVSMDGYFHDDMPVCSIGLLPCLVHHCRYVERREITALSKTCCLLDGLSDCHSIVNEDFVLLQDRLQKIQDVERDSVNSQFL